MKKSSYHYKFIMMLLPLWLGMPSESMAVEGAKDADAGVGKGGADVAVKLEVASSGVRLQDFLGQVMEWNDEIEAQRLEWQSNEKMVSSARGVYEPSLKASLNRSGNHLQNTVKETLNQGYASEYSELNNLWNATIEGLTPLGGTYRLGYDTKELKNSLQSQLTTGGENVTFLGLNLSQPLLKGGGLQATGSTIRIAQANADIAYEGYRQTVVETVARAVQLYWQCYVSQEKLTMRKRSAAIAKEMLKLNQSRYDAGKVDYTEVLDAESGLRLRQALVAAAEQTELTAKRNLLSLSGQYHSELNPVTMGVADAPECAPLNADYAKSLERAYKSYPQYLSALTTVEREKVRLAYAKNQQLPQLDLKGSYGFNGLDKTWGASWDKAWQKDYLSWNLGLELSIPLLGDIKGRNESLAARLRKEQSQKRLEMQKIELANQMEIVSGLVTRVYNQVENYGQVVALNKELSRIEEMRFRMGKSDIRVMLGRDEDYLKVSESLLDSRLAYQYALVNLYVLEGTLLERYGLSSAAKK